MEDNNSRKQQIAQPGRYDMLARLTVLGLTAVLVAGCGTLGSVLPASRMEANEVFRNGADQFTLTTEDVCKAPVEKSSFLAISTSTSQEASAWNVARAYFCAAFSEQAEVDAMIGKQDSNKGDAKKTDGTVPLSRTQYWQRRLVADAVSYSNMNCDYHFRDAETARASFEFAESSLNTIFSAVGAGIASLNSHNRAIFNLATTATAGNGIAANYKATVFLTPVLRKLHKKLDEPRRTISSEIESGLASDKLAFTSTLKSKLVEYDQLCSREALIELLSQSVDIVKYGVNDETPIQDRAAAKKLIAEIATAAGVDASVLTDAYIKTLWSLSSLAAKDKIIENMKKSDDTKVKGQGEIAEKVLKGGAATENAGKLNRIVVLLRLDDDDDLGSIKSTLAKFEPAGGEKAGTTEMIKLTSSPLTKSRSREKTLNDVSTRIFAQLPGR